MNSFVKGTYNTNNFIYKIIHIDTTIKVKPINNLCWLCNMECFTFVRICEDCKYEKYDKKKNKK